MNDVSYSNKVIDLIWVNMACPDCKKRDNVELICAGINEAYYSCSTCKTKFSEVLSHYKLLHSRSLEQLEKQINEFLLNGYVLRGKVETVYASEPTRNLYIQSMVRRNIPYDE